MEYLQIPTGSSYLNFEGLNLIMICKIKMLETEEETNVYLMEMGAKVAIIGIECQTVKEIKVFIIENSFETILGTLVTEFFSTLWQASGKNIYAMNRIPPIDYSFFFETLQEIDYTCWNLFIDPFMANIDTRSYIVFIL